MKPTLYLETSIPSYLTARPSRDLVVAANQEITREWWDTRSNDFALVISELVFLEAAAGDTSAAARRMHVIQSLPELKITDGVGELATHLMKEVPLPTKAQVDALHIAVAATNGVQYLLTWNCKHIHNAEFRPRIERVCRSRGFEPPTICTPQELLEVE